jgi:hypothetical protein
MTSRFSLLAALAISACGDPVHDDAVAALGPEKAGVGKGPDHRPGQPCLTCHGGDGPANLVMSFGGTIYAHQSDTAAAPNAVVRVLGADNRTYETTTNCVGNFWVPASAFQPAYPVKTAVTSGNFSRVMRTEAFRWGSCNECHTGTGAPNSAGHVWVLPEGQPAPSGGCR